MLRVLAINALLALMNDADKAKSARVMQAMLQMTKIDIASLEHAHAGEADAN